MAQRKERSISLPITIASVTVALSIAMLIGWSVEFSRRMSAPEVVAPGTSLLIPGALTLAVSTVVLIMFSIFLVREILEGRKQTRFIDSVTHELKSPLASIKLCLETLSRPELSETQRGNLQEMALSDVERLSTFIDDVLEANRVAHGRPQVLSEVRLAELAGRCAAVVRGRYHLEPSCVSVEVPTDLTLLVDATALETVLKNLLDNAAKYSDPPVSVRLRLVEHTARAVTLEVRDQGIGIGRTDLIRIFERFYRVPAERVRARPGTGLGLWVVSALVRSMGGRIEARSEGPGQGTTVQVRIPTSGRGAGRAA